MANLLLEDVLNEKISVEDIINWLTTDDIEDSKWDDIKKFQCTQCEFLLDFLNFLRDKTKSLRQDSCDAKQSLTKAIRLEVGCKDKKQGKIDKSDRRTSVFNISESQIPESWNNHAYGVTKSGDVQSFQSQPQNTTVLSKKETSPISSDKLKNKIQSADANAVSDLQVLMNSCSRTPKHVGSQRNLASEFVASPNTATSTPIFEKNSSRKSSKVFNRFSEHSSNADTTVFLTDQNFQHGYQLDGSGLSYKESDSYIQNFRNINENFDSSNYLLTSKNSNVPNKVNNFSKDHGRDSNSIEIASISEECVHSNMLNISSRSGNEFHLSNNSMLINGTCGDAVSPLQIPNPSTLRNSKLSSRSVERCQNSKSSPQHNFKNTPKQGSHNIKRKSKSTPRQNASLGDFISIDSWNNKKHSAKKSNPRLQSKSSDGESIIYKSKSTPRQNASLGDFISIDSWNYNKHSAKKNNLGVQSRSSDGESMPTDRLSVAEESFPEIGQSCGRRKRRIKPTKLDVSDNKGNNESSTFGMISRPQIVNPQFLEALPTDKSDTTPFETERDLLRLERQKQQRNLPNPPMENNVPNILLKTTNVKKSAVPLLTPNIESVENRQALDILAKIYSNLLDNNLVLNPMTELNFVISLLTLQHSFEDVDYEFTPSQHCREQKRSAVYSISEEKSTNEIVTIESDESLYDTHEKSKEYINIELLNEELGCKVLSDEIILPIDKSVPSPNTSEFKDGRVFDNFTKSLPHCTENNCTNEHQSTLVEKEKSNVLDTDYFQTIHNCIYFSTSVLNTQRVLLSLLDRATLKLLIENNRIVAFSPDLQEYLNNCYTSKSSESSHLKNHMRSFSTTEANVSFQIDTDNHENFPTLGGFQGFKKQRDLFYEALRIWEMNHLKSGWQFSIALSGKIRALLALCNDIANYCHFARLFKSQLLLSCIGNGPVDDPLDDESFSFIASLKHSNPEKFTRLQKRLVTPLSSGGPVPARSFPGVQEFYKDFILHAGNAMFYAHLQDCLVHEIMELNDTQFTGSEIEDTETMVDEETKRNFITCISSLRLLAKVLGFLVSLPYRCGSSMQESVFSTQLELRSQVLPPINLQFCIQNAIASGKLALTIPWVVKYLAMLDPVSLQLPYSRTVFEMLCYVYCESKHNSHLHNPLSSQVVILIKFSIGWLFDLCNFPERLYFNCRISKFYWKLKSTSDFDSRNLQSAFTIKAHQTNNLNQSENSGPCTDSLDIVDERTLYVCCPFLAELKTVLTAGHSNLNNSTTIRHITPVSSGFDKPSTDTSTKQLQLQLEEAFFHGQPISTRKTVDFICERVASSCVKHICNHLLPRAREKNVAKFQDIISRHELPDDVNKFKTLMSSELRSQFETDISSMCESRTRNSIESLLAEDTLPSVKDMCFQIANRMTEARVNNWIQSHITGGSLLIKDMEMEIDKIYKNKNLLTRFEKRVHNVNAASPTEVIDDLRSLIWEFLDNKGKSVTLERVLQCLDNLYESLTERADLLPGPERVIGTMSVDFALFLAAYRVDIFIPEVHKKLIRIWKMKCLQFLKEEAILSRILSPRNIMLLVTPGNPNVWLPLGYFIKDMLQEEVLSIEALSDQCTKLLRYDWQPVEILKHLSTCLTEAIKDFKSTNQESEKMKLLLEWITETYNDIEFTFD